MGEDHPDTIATRHNIAELYIQWAKPDKAQEYLQKNIEVIEKKQKDHQEQMKQQGVMDPKKVEADKKAEESYF